MTGETASGRLEQRLSESRHPFIDEGMAEQVYDALAKEARRRDSPYSLSAIRAILRTANGLTALTRPLGEGEEELFEKVRWAALDGKFDQDEMERIIAALRSTPPQAEETKLRARVREIADDFHPDRDADAPLALTEMHEALTAALEDSSPSSLPIAAEDELRAQGWAVAVHNDYRLNGEAHTFWLWTHAETGRFVKGEGRTDADALAECVKAASASPIPPDHVLVPRWILEEVQPKVENHDLRGRLRKLLSASSQPPCDHSFVEHPCPSPGQEGKRFCELCGEPESPQPPSPGQGRPEDRLNNALSPPPVVEEAGYRPLYSGPSTICPGCHNSNWDIRKTAECAFCHTVLPIK